jgi:membrane dipeptidase
MIRALTLAVCSLALALRAAARDGEARARRALERTPLDSPD